MWLCAAQTERGNARGGATKKREISCTLLSINLHFSLDQDVCSWVHAAHGNSGQNLTNVRLGKTLKGSYVVRMLRKKLIYIILTPTEVWQYEIAFVWPLERNSPSEPQRLKDFNKILWMMRV